MANVQKRPTQKRVRQPAKDRHRERFGATLRRLREEKGRTRKEAAKQLRIPERTLVEVEAGRAPVELRLVEAAARAFPGSLPTLLQSVLPEEWSDDEVERRLRDAFAEGQLLQHIEGLTRDETLWFVMNVAQLPTEEIRVVNQWVLSRLNYLTGPTGPRLSQLLAEALGPEEAGRRERNAEHEGDQ
jgi:transcriptional regulator with XRE-family HTH domain